jgi:hypothetical protein
MVDRLSLSWFGYETPILESVQICLPVSSLLHGLAYSCGPFTGYLSVMIPVANTLELTRTVSAYTTVRYIYRALPVYLNGISGLGEGDDYLL